MKSFAGFVLAATAALAAVIALRLVRADLAEEVFVLVLGAATLLALVVATRGEKAQPSSFERALRPAPTRSRTARSSSTGSSATSRSESAAPSTSATSSCPSSARSPTSGWPTAAAPR